MKTSTLQDGAMTGIHAAVSALAGDLADIRREFARVCRVSSDGAAIGELRSEIETQWKRGLRGLKRAAAESVVDVLLYPWGEESAEMLEDLEADEQDGLRDHDDDADYAAADIDDEDDVETERERSGVRRGRRGKRGGRRHRRPQG